MGFDIRIVCEVSGRNPLYPRVSGFYMQAGLIGVSREDGHRYRAANVLIYGAGYRNRTRDNLITNQALFQLS